MEQSNHLLKNINLIKYTWNTYLSSIQKKYKTEYKKNEIKEQPFKENISRD